MLCTCLVQIISGWCTIFFKLGFDIASALDPFAVFQAFCFRFQNVDQLRDAIDAENNNTVIHDTCFPNVIMSVINAWNQGLAFQIDHLCIRCCKCFDLTIRT